LYFVSRLIPTPNPRRHKMLGSACPHTPSADEVARLLPKVFRPQIVGQLLV
jgi:hypothetical protein